MAVSRSRKVGESLLGVGFVCGIISFGAWTQAVREAERDHARAVFLAADAGTIDSFTGEPDPDLWPGVPAGVLAVGLAGAGGVVILLDERKRGSEN